jgi:hypothetical protein
MTLSYASRVMLIWVVLAVLVAAASSGFEAAPEKAGRTARRVLERALASKNEDIIPAARLEGAAPGQAVFVHDAVTLEPLYGLVGLMSPAGRLVGVVAVDAGSGKCLWSSLRCDADRLLPVPSTAARIRLSAPAQGAPAHKRP